ncbi:hypothetical protein BVY01_04560 [bacterium I07]|nr:hypothetical protein BVY01_04560 [bacterium I07]
MISKNVTDFLDERFFLQELNSRTKNDVLQELMRPLIESEQVQNAELLHETLRQRELMGSTGLGKGIAVPHCRSTLVSRLLLLVGRSSKGIDYDAVDKKPVHLFFLIVAPPIEDNNDYLPLLGKIVEIVRDGRKRKAMLKAEGFKALVRVFEKG